MSVATGPGTSRFTRTPRLAHSRAMVVVQLAMAAFTAQ